VKITKPTFALNCGGCDQNIPNLMAPADRGDGNSYTMNYSGNKTGCNLDGDGGEKGCTSTPNDFALGNVGAGARG
jgi:hypothetical protein